MVQALIQLLQTKSLSNITISELTERAGVSRMTYYRNYNSMDEIFISYLKDLVDAYRQDVAAWPDKGNYNDYRNMLHCYEYFDHYREFIACLVNTGLGHLLLQALDSYILDTYYTEDKGRDFYYTLRAFSGSLYNIYVTWIMENSMESAEEIVSHYLSDLFLIMITISKDCAKIRSPFLFLSLIQRNIFQFLHHALISGTDDLIHIDQFFNTMRTPSHDSCNGKNRCI